MKIFLIETDIQRAVTKSWIFFFAWNEDVDEETDIGVEISLKRLLKENV